MFERIRHVLNHVWVRFITPIDGAVAPIFALALIPMVGMIGAALDYSRANQVKAKLQGSLDAALLAGAHDGSDHWTQTALSSFNGNAQVQGVTVGSPSFQLDANRAYTGSVTATIPTSFVAMFGISSINMNVSGTASVASTSGNYYCIMALNTSAQAALQLTGNASITITAPKCVVQVNSNNADAVDMSGNAWIKSVENCFVGKLRTTGNASVSPAPDPSCKSVPDPFSHYPRPAVGQCNYTNLSVSGKTMTLQPGVYCGGMNFSGSSNITFAPGLYIVKDGAITESGGSFTGAGVSFFLTGKGASIQLSGNANWHIVAPTNGPLPGFAIFLDPNGPTGLAGKASTLSGNTELYFEGIIYLPQQQVSVTGNGEAFAPSPYTSYIGDTLSFTGNGELIINNDTKLTAVPVPTALMVQTGGQVALSQ
jgi:Flp pilus assembly protein TadG